MNKTIFSIKPLKSTNIISQEIKIKKFSGKKSSGEVKATFQSYSIKDGDQYVAYIPSLEMTGYGKTVDEGLEMLKEAVEDYFENLMKLTMLGISKELSKHGWNRDKILRKQFSNDTFIDKDGVLKGFEMPKDTPIEANRLQMA